MINAAYLRSALFYDQNTGDFHWKEDRKNQMKRGFPAGGIQENGYIYIKITRAGISKLFKAHRLAWLYVYGVWPNGSLDHIDRNRANNRISNLRESNGIENSRNSSKRINCTSRFIGVCWHNPSRKWRAYIRVNQKMKSLGYFKTEIEAALAYNRAAIARDQTFHSLNVIPDSIGSTT